MAWQFDDWKVFAGAAGASAAAAVLVVAGMLGLDVPWFQRGQVDYLSTRDMAEIVGGFAERETAIAASTNFAPLASAWWQGHFPEGAGALATNAIGVYASAAFFDGLESHAEDFFPIYVHPSRSVIIDRRWIAADASGVAAAAGTFDESPGDFVVTAVTNSYMMLEDWWRANVHDGAGRFPTERRYADTNVLGAIHRSMRSLRHQLAPHSRASGEVKYRGSASANVIVSGTPPPSWSAPALSWNDLIAAACSNMLASAVDPDWVAKACFGQEIYAAWECYTFSDSWLDGSVWRDYTYDRRSVRCDQDVLTGDAATLVVGTNVQAVGLARPSRLWADLYPYSAFWHPDHGWTEPATLQAGDCSFAEAAPNAFVVFNELLRFPGHPSQTLIAEVLAASVGTTGFPPAPGTCTAEYNGGALAFGWDQEPGQCGIVLDWTFTHMLPGGAE